MKHPNNNPATVIRPTWTIGYGPKEFGMAYFNSSIRKSVIYCVKEDFFN